MSSPSGGMGRWRWGEVRGSLMMMGDGEGGFYTAEHGKPQRGGLRWF